MRVIDGEQPPLTDEDEAKLAALREEADRLENEWSGQADIPDEIDARVTAIDEEISAIVSRPPVFTPEDMAMAQAARLGTEFHLWWHQHKRNTVDRKSTRLNSSH